MIHARARLALIGCLALGPALACRNDAAGDLDAALPGGAPAPTPTTPDPTPTPHDTYEPGPQVKIPALRTGVDAPTKRDAIVGSVSARRNATGVYAEIELPVAETDGLQRPRAVIDDGRAAIAVARVDGGRTRVLVRWPDGTTPPAELHGSLFTTTFDNGHAHWAEAPFTAGGTGKDDPELPRRFVDAWTADLRGDDGWWRGGPRTTPFHQFAAGRAYDVLLGKDSAAAIAALGDDVRRPSTDLSQLMHTTTAMYALQEALQHDRGLRVGNAAEARDIPIDRVTAPALADHPFATMTAALAEPDGGTPEPLASSVPIDFWYVRFTDIRRMLQVLDEADAWITPVAHAFDERPLVRDLALRYQRQLGLRRTGLAKALGNTVIDRVAIVGSDPYLREGSDVTMIFDVANQTVFDAELARHLEAWQAEVPGVVASEVSHEGHTIAVRSDPAGLVHQHRVQVGELAIVSNSLGACKRVLDAIDGRAPKLADAPDLKYMLARDPGAHDALVFLGDRFIASVVGPAQKILQSRRQRALAELSVPGYAAALHGWLHGAAAEDTAALLAAGALDQADLRHGDGGEITFDPRTGARSEWGTPAALVPLVDRPAITEVSAAEQAAYETFSRSYQDYWRQFIDPIAVRIDITDDAGGSRASVDVRVLPLISGSEYGDVEMVVGEQRVRVPPVDAGIQAVWAIGKDAAVRRELDRFAGMVGNNDLGFGWLGEWAMIGTLDRVELVELMAYEDDWDDGGIQLPRTGPEGSDHEVEMVRRIGRLPLFAVADVDNPAGLVATLAAGKTMLQQVAPGMVLWESNGEHAGIPIVEIKLSPTAPDADMKRYADAFAIYYAQAGGAIAVALDKATLAVVIDRLADDARRPQPVDAGETQFVLDAHAPPGSPLATAALWALQSQADLGQGAARRFAEVLLRGDPSLAGDDAAFRSRALAYFGAIPVTPEGRTDYGLRREGVFDPVHGSEIIPSYPALPVAEDAPISILLARLGAMRAEIAFDREPAKMEPPARSLHTRLELHLRAPE